MLNQSVYIAELYNCWCVTWELGAEDLQVYNYISPIGNILSTVISFEEMLGALASTFWDIYVRIHKCIILYTCIWDNCLISHSLHSL